MCITIVLNTQSADPRCQKWMLTALPGFHRSPSQRNKYVNTFSHVCQMPFLSRISHAFSNQQYCQISVFKMSRFSTKKFQRNKMFLQTKRCFWIFVSPARSAFAMPFKNIVMNHSSEYWYIGSMLARSATQKNRICVFTATGTYKLLVSSMSFSVSSAMVTLA